MSFFDAATGMTRLGAQPLVVGFDQTDYDQVYQTFNNPAQIGISLTYNTGEIHQHQQLDFPGFVIGTFWTGTQTVFDAADYDYMWDQQGPFAPQLGFSPINTWILGVGGGGGPEWEYEVFTGGPPEIAQGILRIRDATTLIEVTQANNTMEVVVGP